MISRIAHNFATSNKIYKIDSVPVRLGATGRLLEYAVFGFFLDAKTRYRESLMQSYHLTDEFTDIAAEQAVLASIKQSPALYWDFVDFLTLEVFTKEASTWQALTLALETAQPLRGYPETTLGKTVYLVDS